MPHLQEVLDPQVEESSLVIGRKAFSFEEQTQKVRHLGDEEDGYSAVLGKFGC